MLKVILSFDLEFSVGGAFGDLNKEPLSNQLFDYSNCKGNGFSEVLSVLNNYNTKATFFTEILQSYYFKRNVMGQYVDLLLKNQQDIQMHTHPCWKQFKGGERKLLEKAPVDNFNNNSITEIIDDLEYGLKVFDTWGVKRPKAFRAGNLVSNSLLYNALFKCGFELSSNIGLNYHIPKEKELQLENCISNISNIWEIPVTTFQSMGCRDKVLTITGTSLQEMKSVLKKCIEKKIKYVVVLTHIHEYLKYKDNLVKKNKVNISRLENICHYINESKEIEFESFGNIDVHNLKTTNSNNYIKTNVLEGLASLGQNQLNDQLWCI